MSARLDEVVVETGELFELDFLVLYGGNDSAATGGAEVNGEEIVLFFH